MTEEEEKAGAELASRDAGQASREITVRGPFSRLGPAEMRRLLIISGAASALLFLILTFIDQRIKESGGPGIVAFEVAGTASRAAEILREWGDSGRSAARISIFLDFPFLVAYAIFFSAACTEMGRRLRVRAADGGAIGRIARHLATPAPWLGWAFFAAAFFDVIENLVMLRVLENRLTWASTAQIAASPKFAIFGAGIFFLVASLLLTLRRRGSANVGGEVLARKG